MEGIEPTSSIKLHHLLGKLIVLLTLISTELILASDEERFSEGGLFIILLLEKLDRTHYLKS
jgi:hypothetical protein